MTQVEITSEVVTKILSTIDQGLTHGLGNPIPGQMCVEAAICYSLGLEHGDDPKCVALSIRALKLRLNDSNWSSDAARAKGLRKLAILQLGTSNNFNNIVFTTKVAMLAVNKYLPIALKVTKTDDSIIDNCKAASNLKEAAAAVAEAAATESEAAATESEAAATESEAAEAAAVTAAVAEAAEAAESAAESAAAAAAAESAAAAAAESAAAESAAASYAAKAASYAAYAAADAADAAAYAAYAAAAADAILFNFAEDIASILIEMQVPGVQWLDLL